MIRSADDFDTIRARLKAIQRDEGRSGTDPVAEKMSYPETNYTPPERAVSLTIEPVEGDGWMTYEDGC